MGQHGRVAIRAVELFLSGVADDPKDAWDIASYEIIASQASRDKGCPGEVFLSLCEEGLIKGVPAGDYTNSIDNKGYAVKAVELLTENPSRASNKSRLWDEVRNYEIKNQNEQMDVVVSLWRDGFIRR